MKFCFASKFLQFNCPHDSTQSILMCNRMQKIWEKLHKLRKSCNHKGNIYRIYSEKLHQNYIQQLSTLRLKTQDLIIPTAFSPLGGPQRPHKNKKRLRTLGNQGSRVKENENFKLRPSIASSCQQFKFIIILLKIAKK